MDARVGCEFGSHRSLQPLGALPQAALRLDNDFSHTFESELLLEVDALNIDAASFRQMRDAEAQGAGDVVSQVRSTIASRGKQHNPVTGSGGMLLGRVRKVGTHYPRLSGRSGPAVGTRVASLVSLTLTPLTIERFDGVDASACQIQCEGQAVLFASGIYAVMPDDLAPAVALSLFDVCGAAPRVSRLCKPGERVLVLGAAGKSGVLCAAAAREAVGPQGTVVGVETQPAAAAELEALSICDAVIVADARDALATRDRVLGASAGSLFDRCVSCVNVPGVELAAVLPVRNGGSVLYFAMSTSFTGAALGAEGVGRDVELLIGNGYAEGHAEHTLGLARRWPDLLALFQQRHGR